MYRRNAIRFPEDDQFGSESERYGSSHVFSGSPEPAVAVSRIAVPNGRVDRTLKISPRPRRSLTNASQRPSGDQAGSDSFLGWVVTRYLPAPFPFITQMSLPVLVEPWS